MVNKPLMGMVRLQLTFVDIIRIQTDGANSFCYTLEHDRLTDVDIQFLVSGVTGSKVPRSSLPTSDTSQSTESETFTWYYPGLIPNRNILLELPTHLSFAQRVARLQNTFQMLAGLAPFLVAFFLISLAVLFRPGKVDLRLEGYLMVGLCLGFLGLAIGWRETTLRTGWLLIIFLAIFSLGLFTPWQMISNSAPLAAMTLNPYFDAKIAITGSSYNSI